MKRRIHVSNYNAATPGKSGIYKNAPRKVLERTLLDMLTVDEDIDFCEAQELVEEFADKEDLIEMIWKLENGKTTQKAILESYGY